MRTDGLFTIHEVRMDAKINETITLIPFGDVHYGSPAFCRNKWREFADRVAGQPRTYFIGMGDYTDSFSTSERLQLAGLHDSSLEQIEANKRQLIEDMAKDLSFMKGNVFGLLGGNHFTAFADGTTGDMLLANRLGTRYLGACSFMRVSFKWKGKCTCSIDIFAHHGKGGGVTAGGRLNAVEGLIRNADADIFLMGDNHARGVLPLGDTLRLASAKGKLHLTSRKRWIARTGSFLRGYVPDKRSYVVDAVLPPSSLGWIAFFLTLRRSRDGGEDRTTVEIEAKQ